MAINSRDYFTAQMLRRQFTPAMLSAVGLAVGDIADAVVIGQRMGEIGLAAISLALPAFMVINILMHGLGIGGSIRFSTLLAQGKRQEAAAGFQGLLGIASCVGVMLALLGNLFLVPLLSILGTTSHDGVLFETSRRYLQIIISGTPLFFISYILNYYLRNDDNEKLASIGFTVGNLSDITLNIIFVLVLDLGVGGAAWSTLIGQMIAICIYLYALQKKQGVLRLCPFNPLVKGTLSCFRVGFSSSAQYLFSLLFILIANNMLLVKGGSMGVAVFDVVQNAALVILYLYDGTAKAAQPLISTYMGEQNKESCRYTLKLSVLWGSLVGVAAMLLVAIFPEAVCRLFGLVEMPAMTMGVYALRVFCMGAGFAGISILLESYLQSCGEERSAFILTTLRGAVILLPMTVLFSVFSIRAFWWIFPVTEIMTVLVFFVLQKYFHKDQSSVDQERVYSKTIQNKNEEFILLITEIQAFCERWEATAKQSYFVTMTAEELCSVIMIKGFDKTDGYIQVTLIAQENSDFTLYIRDSAVSFNPFSMQTKKASRYETFDMGAMGIFVIRAKAKEFFYRRYQGFNTLVVRI